MQKGTIEDEIFEWHHQLNGQALGDGEGQGSLTCCSPWGCKELDRTELLNNNESITRGFLDGSVIKNLPDNTGDAGSIPGSNRFLEEEMATHFSILAWEIPWREEPGGLQSTGLQRVRHDLETLQQQQSLTEVIWVGLMQYK